MNVDPAWDPDEDIHEIDTQLEEPEPLVVLGHVDAEGRVHFAEDFFDGD